MMKPIDVVYVEIEFPEQHDLEKFIEETDEYLFDSFTCFHKPSEHTFVLSYLTSEVTPVLNEAGNVLLQVYYGGEFDESFRIQNEEDYGVELEEITIEFMMESIVVSFAVARQDVDGEIDANCILRKMIVENFKDIENIEDIEKIPIELSKSRINDFEIDLARRKIRADYLAKRSAELSDKYLAIDSFSAELTLVCAGGKEGFINKEGEMVVKPQFDKVYALSDGLARVQMGNKWGFLNAQGELVIEAQYNDAYPFYDGVAAVKKGKTWGMINQQGEIVVDFEYDEINGFSEGLAVILKITPREEYRYGYITTQGQVVIEPQYRSAYPFSGGHAVVFNGSICQIIDTKGRVVNDLPPESYVGSGFCEGLAMFSMKVDGCNKYGYINTEGNIAIDPQYDSVWKFENGLARVELEQDGERLIGIIDRDGKVVAEPQYDYIDDFNEGLAAVCKAEKYGFIDENGRLVIKPQFSGLGSQNRFSEGLAVVRQGKKYGYIDKAGLMVIPPQFDRADDFMEGLAVVREGGKCGYIDKAGVMVISPRFDVATGFMGGLAKVKINEWWGFIDRDGQIVIAPQFNSIREGFIEGVAWVELRDGLNVYINKKGEILAVANEKRRKLSP